MSDYLSQKMHTYNVPKDYFEVPENKRRNLIVEKYINELVDLIKESI